MDPAELGLEIKLLRERRRLTGKEMAEKIGLSQSQLSRLEKGDRRVEATLLGKIAKVLDVTPGFFFRESAIPGEPPPDPSEAGDAESDSIDESTASALGTSRPPPIGRLIREARRRLHLTAEEVAYKIGRGKSFVRSVESGEIELLNAEVTTKLCKTLRLDPAQFIDAQRSEIKTLQKKVNRLERAHAGLTLGELIPTDGGGSELVEREQGGAAPGRGARRAIPLIVGPDGRMPAEVGPAGVPEGEVEDFVFVPGLRDQDVFAVFHVGDDMEPMIHDGDVCVFAPRSDVRNGDVALVVPEDGARPIVRQVFFDPRGTVRLQPKNVETAPILRKRAEIPSMARLVARVERA